MWNLEFKTLAGGGNPHEKPEAWPWAEEENEENHVFCKLGSDPKAFEIRFYRGRSPKYIPNFANEVQKTIQMIQIRIFLRA